MTSEINESIWSPPLTVSFWKTRDPPDSCNAQNSNAAACNSYLTGVFEMIHNAHCEIWPQDTVASVDHEISSRRFAVLFQGIVSHDWALWAQI